MSMIDIRLRSEASARPLQVAILLFPEVEVLDFAGPFEVFSVAGRILRGDLSRGTGAAAGHPPFRVSTVARQAGPVTARHGLDVLAMRGFDDREPVDILVVPGGIVDQLLRDAETLAWVQRMAAEATLTASVCTGAFVLAAVGLLAGRRCTTHWEDIPALRAAHPELAVLEDVPFVDEGRIVSAAGISAGIGMSLHLVGRILGPEAACRTALQMQYDWAPAPAAA
jgi:transcriptional regulator GlxA family with amidase domain